MVVNQTNIFNIYDLLVNELIGDVWLFLLMGALIIAFICIRKNIQFRVMAMFELIWFMIAYNLFGGSFQMIWVGIIFGVFTLFALVYTRTIKRN